MTRVAAVDIGTNSTRLLVAEIEGGRITDLARRSVVTRLGEGVDARRTLQPAPIDRTCAVLADYRAEAERHGAARCLAVATSAVRDAENGAAFLERVGRETGFETRLLSGEQEADLTRRGVGALEPGTLVLDVGGGSTELILADFRTSLDIGSVRLTERFLQGDPPTAAELASAARFVAGLLPELEVDAAIGVAGTVSQLVELVGDLTLTSVEQSLDRLAALPLSERIAVPDLDPARAPVILGGILIVREVMRRYGLEQLGWSLRDLLDGVALEAARD